MCQISADDSPAMQFTLYSSVESQWVGVTHLTLLEKGYNKDEYEVKEISLSEHSEISRFAICVADCCK